MISAVPSLPVRDLSISTNFYTEILGFQLVKSDQTSVCLRNGDVGLRLYEKDEPSSMYCGFYVKRIDQHLPTVLTIKDLSYVGKLRINQEGVLYFLMKDPDGNMIEIMEKPA